MAEIPVWLQELLSSQEKARIDREKQHQEEMNTLRSLLVNVNRSQQDPLVPAENGSSQTTPKEKSIVVQKPSTLQITTNYSQFIEWRESWRDYAHLAKLDSCTPETQRAHLRSCMSEEMRTHLKCAIGIERSTTLSSDQILDKIQENLRNKKNIVIDRVAFVERKQEENEEFDLFYVALKKLAIEADICENCHDQRIITQVVAGVRSQELRQKLQH